MQRLRRATFLTIAGLACSVALAAPAQAATPIQVKMNGGVLAVTGTTGGDSITVDQPGGLGSIPTVTVSGNTITPGAGCFVVSSRTVTCSETFQISVASGGGNDAVRVKTSTSNPTRAIVTAGAGRDVVFGGAGNDEIRGGTDDDITLDGGVGFDTINGGTGVDDCEGEAKTACEL